MGGAPGQHDSLVTEEPALAREPARVAGQGGIAADQAVTRHDDGHGVARVGGSNSADGSGAANSPREGSVGNGAAGRDATERHPHLPLERRAAGLHGNIIDRNQIARQIGSETSAETERVDRRKEARIPVARRQHGPQPIAAVAVVEAAQPSRASDKDNGAERAPDLVGQEIHA